MVFNFKMAIYCSTVYSLFFVSVVLATAMADRCQIVLLNRCREVYRNVLEATSTGEGGHCLRLQQMVTCLANEPKCEGELIEKFRYWMLQMAMMDNILGTCKDMNYNTLTSVVQESDVAKTHRYLDDVVTPTPIVGRHTKFDSFEDCAVTVHKKCVRYYTTLLAKDHQICEDAGRLNTCYDLYSRSINCKAKIIKHFVSMVENVAQRVLHLLIKYMKALCTSSAEL